MQIPRAVPFIRYDSSGLFALDPEAEAFLKALPPQAKIKVISIVGKYRTGKSFFVNRVLLGTKGGFKVGSTINACTMGLWLWLDNIQKQNQEFVTLLIDSEGFGAVQEQSSHDSKIFLFALLLSSFFIFNSVSSIDQANLNLVNLILKLAQEINLTAQIGEEFPFFLWLIRDFALQLVDREGNKITSDEYLQGALQQVKGGSEKSDSKNQIRKNFKKYFSERACRTMVIPSMFHNDLRNLDQIENSRLRPQFVKEAAVLRKFIFQNLKPKQYQGRFVNGLTLIQLTKSYITTLNKQGIIDIQNTWDIVSRMIEHQTTARSLEQFTVKASALPLQNYESELLALKEQVLGVFERELMVEGEYKSELVASMKARLQQLEQIKKAQKKQTLNQLYLNTIKTAAQPLLTAPNAQQISLRLKQLKLKFEELPGSAHKWQLFQRETDQLMSQGLQHVNKLNEEREESLKKQLQLQKKMVKFQSAARQNDLQQKKQRSGQKFLSMLNQVQQPQTSQFSQYGSRQMRQQQNIETRLNDFQEQLYQMQKSHHKSIEELKDMLIFKTKEAENIASQYQTKIKQLSLQLQAQKQKITLTETQKNKLLLELDAARAQLLKANFVQQQKDRDIVELREQVETINLQLADSSSKRQLMQRQISEWNAQKACLQNQINLLKSQLQENKSLHDALIMALQHSTEKQHQHSHLQGNFRGLRNSFEKLQAKCSLLQDKKQELQVYKRMFKSASRLVCSICSGQFRNEQFLAHHKKCGQPHQLLKKHQNLATIYVSIVESTIQQGIDGRPFTRYSIEVLTANKKIIIMRSFRQFLDLHNGLLKEGILIDLSQDHVLSTGQDLINLFSNKRSSLVQERRKSLQHYLRELVKVGEAINGVRLQTFLGLISCKQNQF